MDAFDHALETLDQSPIPEARKLFSGEEEIVVARAPGRLDLMGGIADYSGSLVLQWPIREATLVALQRIPQREITVVSLGTGDERSSAFTMPLADFEADPENPQPLIFLANQKLYREEQPKAAMAVIDRAVEVALRFGMFRREALGVKARIALALNRHDVVEDMLRQIMALAFTRGNADIGAERDFLDRLPPGSIDADVARA